MGTLLLELQNQKNRLELTRAKRKPKANKVKMLAEAVKEGWL